MTKSVYFPMTLFQRLNTKFTDLENKNTAFYLPPTQIQDVIAFCSILWTTISKSASIRSSKFVQKATIIQRRAIARTNTHLELASTSQLSLTLLSKDKTRKIWIQVKLWLVLPSAELSVPCTNDTDKALWHLL